MSDSPEGSAHHVRFSAFVTSSPSPSSPQPQQSLTKGFKLSRDEAVSVLCSQAGYSNEEAAAVIEQAKANRAEEKRELRTARIDLRTMITANADLLKQVENLKQINSLLVKETSSLKRTIREMRKQLDEIHDDREQQQQQQQTRQRRRKTQSLLE